MEENGETAYWFGNLFDIVGKEGPGPEHHNSSTQVLQILMLAPDWALDFSYI
jgi:hypothetical protein